MNNELRGISGINLLVNDYQQALDFYCKQLGFIELEHSDLGDGNKWIKLNASAEQPLVGLILSKAKTDEEKQLVGKQAGEGVLMILQTANFDISYRRLKENGINFIEQPRNEPYGKVAIFKDLYGNKWDLIEPAF
ncbi:VOC family protein [Thalassotalea atypica]|uniref:VOC family protein n=1 Tax=Thalassotalea atypica TaxID=2054316 RepID=UPI002573E6DB|nr:VOC family protein [Thalassotalea atypica]